MYKKVNLFAIINLVSFFIVHASFVPLLQTGSNNWFVFISIASYVMLLSGAFLYYSVDKIFDTKFLTLYVLQMGLWSLANFAFAKSLLIFGFSGNFEIGRNMIIVALLLYSIVIVIMILIGLKQIQQIAKIYQLNSSPWLKGMIVGYKISIYLMPLFAGIVLLAIVNIIFEMYLTVLRKPPRCEITA